jgi:hypothetical protein
LPDFVQAANNYSAHFTVFYAEISQQESIHCLLLENKAVVDQQQQFVSKTEKNLHFQTGFLFEELLYLFNNQGLRCFDMACPDIDYLLLIFAKKDIEDHVFKQFLHHLALYSAKDVSYLLEREQTSTEAKIVAFLRDFYCKYEVKANQLSRKKKTDYLSPIRQIPIQNLQFPIPIRLENASLFDHLQPAEKYLALMTEEYA